MEDLIHVHEIHEPAFVCMGLGRGSRVGGVGFRPGRGRAKPRGTGGAWGAAVEPRTIAQVGSAYYGMFIHPGMSTAPATNSPRATIPPRSTRRTASTWINGSAWRATRA